MRAFELAAHYFDSIGFLLRPDDVIVKPTSGLPIGLYLGMEVHKKAITFRVKPFVAASFLIVNGVVTMGVVMDNNVAPIDSKD